MIKSLFVLLLITGFFTAEYAQQVIPDSNVIFVDNVSDGNSNGSTGTIMNTPTYKEFPQTNTSDPNVYGWWENTAAYFYGGTARRASRFGAGNNEGAHAQFYCPVNKDGSYIIYHNMYSQNSTTNAIVTFKRPTDNSPADGFLYNEMNNNTPEGLPSWYPLGIINLSAGDLALTVDIGLGIGGKNILRTDAVALLRSSQAGPDIEFGARRFTQTEVDPISHDTLYNFNFYKDRAPLYFSPTVIFSSASKELTIYNPGTSSLIISGISMESYLFTIEDTFPVTIPAGGKKNIIVKFLPRLDTLITDTIIFYSNDLLEPEAKLPLYGEGVNYNFILNASLDGSEPHYNIENASFETIGSGWLPSTPSPYPYPITEGNKKSIINTGDQSQCAAVFHFPLPDSLGGEYYLDYSSPYSSSAPTEAKLEIVTPSFSDTQRVAGFNENLEIGGEYWKRVGGDTSFILQGGGETTIKLTNVGSGFLRADLLRFTKVLYLANLQCDSRIEFIDAIISQLKINSLGKNTLVIDTIYFEKGTNFKIDDIDFPLTIPELNGSFNLNIYCLNPSAVSEDILKIKSNDNYHPYHKVTVVHEAVTPVELISFKAEYKENKIILNWSTATETNNRRFEIVRKIGDQEWEIIGSVNGNGTTTEKHDYYFTDNNISAQGEYFYRLKQINFDGSFENSNKISVNVNFVPKEYKLYPNYPNPFNPSTTIKYEIPEVGLVTIKLYDILGNEVQVLINEKKEAGKYKLIFNASIGSRRISSGVYFYELSAGSFRAVKKIILLK